MNTPRAFDTGEIQALIFDLAELDPADLVSEEAGLSLPPEPETLKDVMGPRDRGEDKCPACGTPGCGGACCAGWGFPPPIRRE